MSFDVNVLSTKPVIKAAASMQNDESIFMKKDEGDIFTFDKEPEMPEDNFSITKLIAEIIIKIKSFFIKSNK